MTVHVAPNPCFGPTSFAIDLPKAGEVSVDLYDVYGRRVRRLMEGPAEAGRMSLPCDPIGLPGGAYQVVVRSDEGVASARMLLAR